MGKDSEYNRDYCMKCLVEKLDQLQIPNLTKTDNKMPEIDENGYQIFIQINPIANETTRVKIKAKLVKLSLVLDKESPASTVSVLEEYQYQIEKTTQFWKKETFERIFISEGLYNEYKEKQLFGNNKSKTKKPGKASKNLKKKK